MAECILPGVLSAAAAATKLLARHGMIDAVALHVTTATGRGWDVGVGACGPQAKLTSANRVSLAVPMKCSEFKYFRVNRRSDMNACVELQICTKL